MPAREREPILMVVKQRSFRLPTGNFCKALPIASLEGEFLDSREFPNDGEIWWMLTPYAETLAKPGRLIVGEIEEAVAFDPNDANNSKFQIKRDSPRPPDPDQGLEIVEVPPEVISDITDLAVFRTSISFPYPPASHVLLHWNGHVYGPFDTVDCVEEDRHNYRVLFQAPQQNTTIKCVEDSLFEQACGKQIYRFSADVSIDESHPHAPDLHALSYRFLNDAGYQLFKGCSGETIDMEPVDQKLLRFSKSLLTRRKRRELSALLSELQPLAEQAADPDEFLGVLKKVVDKHQRHDESLDRISDALIRCGIISDEKIEEAKKRYVDEYISSHAAEFQTQIEKQIEEKQRQLDGLTRELRNKRENEVNALTRELESLRSETVSELQEQRLKLEDDQRCLAQKEDFLHKNLKEAADKLTVSGDQVITSFMSILPLLQKTGFLKTGPQPVAAADGMPQPQPRSTRSFELPAFVTDSRSRPPDMAEKAFFDRFVEVVENSGFKYSPLDLARYHLSVKCSELTILGGPSGTGKTSLALLYARALRGEFVPDGRDDLLVVNVNPSWMEVRDIIGHMNTIEGRFCPSGTGLYEYLIFAQEEHQLHRDSSPLYPICFDEMNLAQIEHYFSDFLQLIEMPFEARILSCFNKAVAGGDCPYRRWPKLKLAPTLRFIGTVNFDETTRRLSDRMLDRANLVTIRPGMIPSTVVGTDALADCGGAPVTLGDYNGWIRDAALPANLAKILDDCRRPLEQMGVPLSPRVYRGICRFVASAAPILSEEKAFDIQISQRVLSRVRDLVTNRQHDALDRLNEILLNNSVCSFDESVPLLEEIRLREQYTEWNAGDLG